ncbi:MAG: hypothetical protein EA359_01160 [Balneolaceae bacterium]|nr:MAG: hypothetical protein EA359_01160 [Balneolaceae bacterium]
MFLGSISRKRFGEESDPPPMAKPLDELSLPSNPTPSTTKSGWLEPVMEEKPLIMKFVPVPVTPLVFVMLTPGNLPESERTTSDSVLRPILSAVICETP